MPGPQVTCPTTTLAPAATTTCTLTWTVTQANIDDGILTNSATATGGDPFDNGVKSGPSVAAVEVSADAALSLTRTADPEVIHNVGDPVTYTVVVTNSGALTIHRIAIDDVMTAPAGPALTFTCADTILAPGGSTTCTASYTATAADVDNGAIDDPAAPTGLDPHGNPIGTDSLPAHVSIPAAPSLSIELSADTATVAAVGDVINYSFLVKNTGNVSLTELEVVHAFFLPGYPQVLASCPGTRLAAGADMTCTSEYTVTQDALDVGYVYSGSAVSGSPPEGEQVNSDPSFSLVSATLAPGLSLATTVHTADTNSNGTTDVGDTISWTFTLTNTGNLTLATPAVTDPFGGSVTCPRNRFAPGESVTCTADHPHTVTSPTPPPGS